MREITAQFRPALPRVSSADPRVVERTAKGLTPLRQQAGGMVPPLGGPIKALEAAVAATGYAEIAYCEAGRGLGGVEMTALCLHPVPRRRAPALPDTGIASYAGCIGGNARTRLIVTPAGRSYVVQTRAAGRWRKQQAFPSAPCLLRWLDLFADDATRKALRRFAVGLPDPAACPALLVPVRRGRGAVVPDRGSLVRSQRRQSPFPSSPAKDVRNRR